MCWFSFRPPSSPNDAAANAQFAHQGREDSGDGVCLEAFQAQWREHVLPRPLGDLDENGRRRFDYPRTDVNWALGTGGLCTWKRWSPVDRKGFFKGRWFGTGESQHLIYFNSLQRHNPPSSLHVATGNSM